MRVVALAVAFAAFALLAHDARAQDQKVAGMDYAATEPSFGDEAFGHGAIDGEIAIDLRDDATEADVADIAGTYGVTMHPNSGWSVAHDRLEVAKVDPAREQALIELLSRDRRIEHVEPMTLYHVNFVPNDPLYGSKQWHLQRVGAQAAWQYSCGRGVTVAVVDTGIACFDKGPFSRGSDLAETRCDGGWNFIDDSGDAYDDHGHGTHVAGTIAQTTNNGMGTAGLAFCATLMPIKVLNKQGFGTVANVAEGIRYAADEGAQIINLSLGGPIKSRILGDAVEHAIAKGVVVVAAAGNSGRTVGWPAAYAGVIAVSATDSADHIAWFSSRGPEVAIAAPGVSITQQTICNGGRDRCEVFSTFNGTSMASPHVAGVAAMVIALGTTDATSVRDILESTARRPVNASPPASRHDEPAARGDRTDVFGAGLLDAAAATSHVFWAHVVLRAVALLGLAWIVASRIHKRGGKVARSPVALVGALATSVGLFPLSPLFALPFHGRNAQRVVELMTRPLGEWDLVVMGAGAHRWLLFASALPAIGLTAVAFASPRARPLIGGVALGTGALLASIAFVGDVAFVAGPFFLRVWTLGNLLVCLWLARAALDVRS